MQSDRDPPQMQELTERIEQALKDREKLIAEHRRLSEEFQLVKESFESQPFCIEHPEVLDSSAFKPCSDRQAYPIVSGVPAKAIHLIAKT